jgi:exodeoxyribonuclease VII large subunit
MNQLPLFSLPVWSVLELTNFIRNLLESEETLQDIWVQGEVSNFSRPASGHIYFTLKDVGASLRCVMWRNNVICQDFIPTDGDAIEVHGSIGVYEVGGQYQLYVDVFRPVGEGILYQEFLRLRAQLEAEGLFVPERKRAIPSWPKCIGIVTSPTGAALRDILNTLRRRYPLVEVVLSPCPVQGDAAPMGIVAAINDLNACVHPDVIILARGGGSIEDLWAFNDERVARTIFASEAPVISGVGHETDFTIADFVADLRAPTPTAAAELATPDQADLRLELTGFDQRLARNIQGGLTNYESALDARVNLLYRYTPRIKIRSDRQRLDELNRNINLHLSHQIQLRQSYLLGLAQRFSILSPISTLARGYAVVTDIKGQIIRRIKQVNKDDNLKVQVSDGQFSVAVKDILSQ